MQGCSTSIVDDAVVEDPLRVVQEGTGGVVLAGEDFLWKRGESWWVMHATQMILVSCPDVHALLAKDRLVF